jgi:nickel/cobalt transporter (NicO) family protein
MRTLVALSLALPTLAVAHPLGNFTINRYAAVHVAPHALAVRYVVDMAEIPAYEEIAAIDTDGNGTLDPSERAAYLARIPGDLARGLSLTVDGRPLAFGPGVATLELPPGAGGLPTLRLDIAYTVSLASARGMVELHDRNFAGRPGWQEMIADADDGVAVVDSTVPRADRSSALRAYPADLLASPPQVTESRFRIGIGTTSRDVVPTPAGVLVGAGRFRDRFTELVATSAPLDAGLVLGSFLVAAALGALHALGPGHGKSIVGAYLIGARGTARHALFLGVVVTATHTLGVYVLGLATLAASRWIVPERLFPWLGAASGMMVVGIGASLARARLETAHHDHHHHPHHHDHGHAHLPAGGDPITWRGLLALGVSGGLVPCPSALVVMLGAIALGRIAFGLALIVAFSVGLAAVLTAIGLIFVRARRWFDRLPVDGVVARWAPVASAVVVSAAGVLIVIRAMGQIG